MPSSTNRRRVEVPSDLHDRLSRHAQHFHLNVSALASYLLTKALDTEEAAQSMKPFQLVHEMVSPSSVPEEVWEYMRFLYLIDMTESQELRAKYQQDAKVLRRKIQPRPSVESRSRGSG